MEPSLEDFFQFFAEEFQWGMEVVSVRRGRRCNATGGDFPGLLAANGWKYRQQSELIFLEDPFELERDLSCTIFHPNEVRLKEAIENEYTLKMALTLNS